MDKKAQTPQKGPTMKTYTVSFFGLVNACSALPSNMITTGIAVTEYGDSKIPQIHLGLTTKGGSFHFCEIATEMTKAIKGGLLLDSFPIEHRYGATKRTVFKTDHGNPHSRHANSIIVRVNTRTQRCLGLTVSEITGGHNGGVKLLSMGGGCDAGSQWDDGIFTIEPHCAVVLEKNGKPYMVVANSGGNCEEPSLQAAPLVMNWEEYNKIFQPHLQIKPAKYVVTEDLSSTATAEGTPAKKFVVRNAERDTIFDGMGEYEDRVFIPDYLRG